ncbi:MAG: hypothetical protein OMM_13728 [Candidatus Magnetoglobus multicellularis str. Araruama]|uniref:Uncharacterized protein n=1 Tax=Candidatus Magnetoglobus multicellularis str. Araruama TaxID=890399 RepID=A0A1V1NT64_9BACT|nr:MAG: hypothetical protein OMM_13728 [Candidatus Magnetoglobus multicellularis str. Araruama]
MHKEAKKCEHFIHMDQLILKNIIMLDEKNWLINVPVNLLEISKKSGIILQSGVRLKAVLSANSAMLILYWDIGNTILEKQKLRDGAQRSLIDFLMI